MSLPRFRPGDLVYVVIRPCDLTSKAYDWRRGVVVSGPDSDGSWALQTPVGTLRCVDDELIMLMDRDRRYILSRGLRTIDAWRIRQGIMNARNCTFPKNVHELTRKAASRELLKIERRTRHICREIVERMRGK